MIQGDSSEYELLTEAVQLTNHLKGATMEIGLRRGYGSLVMMQASSGGPHIAVDPYGHIPYNQKEGNELTRLDYTNAMRNECLIDMYQWALENNFNFVFFNLRDLDYFQYFKYGVPIFENEPKTCHKYRAVHLDAGHIVSDLDSQICFFMPRQDTGAMIVIDDIDFFDFDIIVRRFDSAYEVYKRGSKKAILRRL